MENITRLIKTYADGSITTAELQELSQWAHANEDNRKAVRDMLEAMVTRAATDKADKVDVEAAISRLHAHAGVQPHRQIHLWRIIARVAAVALIAALPVAGYFVGRNGVHQQFADISVVAPKGSQLSLTLPDSSKVTLAPQSRLTYSQGYGISNRAVRLEGEGYFTITHHDDKPFTLSTASFTVNDLGTTFMVRDYSDEHIAITDLLNGKVAVTGKSKPAQPRLMHPGERLTLDKQTGRMTCMKAEEVMLDKAGSLNFIGTRLEDIARQLSRAYDADIHVRGKAKDARLYGFFDTADYTLKDILTALTTASHTKYAVENGAYTIY